MEIEFVATCLFGLEHFLGEEIDRLGYRRTETIDGRVSFIGDERAIARCNIWLRCAERLFIKMGSFRARTFGELFEGTKAMEWERFIGREDAFPVKGHSVKSKLFSIPDFAFSASLARRVLLASIIPKPNSALSSNREFCHAGPWPALLTV